MTDSTVIPLSSRAQGCLLGLACGNVLGLPFEDLFPATEVFRVSGGSVREIDPAEKTKPWDDETAQAVVVSEALGAGSLELRSLAQRLVVWRGKNGRGIPNLVDRVLDEIEGEVPVEEASEDAFQRMGRNWSASNSALVRAIPVAVRHYQDPRKIASETAIAVKVTHWNPLCVWSATALNLAIATILRDETLLLPALAEEMRGHGAPTTVCDAVYASRAPISMYLLDGKAKSYTLKALQVGLWALLNESPVEDLLETVVLEGGDTGANAAVAGACLGARRGRAALPERWIAALHEPELLAAVGAKLAG